MNNNKKQNEFAIIGFVLSFFSSIFGLIFSIIGLVQAKEKNNGKGFAIAGIIISVVKIILLSIICAIFGTVFSSLIYPEVKGELERATYCSMAYDCKDSNVDGIKICKYLDENSKEQEVRCEVDMENEESNESNYVTTVEEQEIVLNGNKHDLRIDKVLVEKDEVNEDEINMYKVYFDNIEKKSYEQENNFVQTDTVYHDKLIQTFKGMDNKDYVFIDLDFGEMYGETEAFVLNESGNIIWNLIGIANEAEVSCGEYKNASLKGNEIYYVDRVNESDKVSSKKDNMKVVKVTISNDEYETSIVTYGEGVIANQV